MPKTEVKQLSWIKDDFESKFGFVGGEYTTVNSIFTIILGLLFTIAFYAVILCLPEYYTSKMFTERGLIPYFIVILSMWSIAIMLVKWTKIRSQKKALQLNIIPEGIDFVLAPRTVKLVLDRIHNQADNPKSFIALNRIVCGLSNLKNIGRVSDLSEVLRTQADNDEQQMETSYLMINGLIWTVPVLGFIGTVIGLSNAVGGFGNALSHGTELSELKNELQAVTSGLATAFETTLVALVFAVILQLLSTYLKTNEENLLISCSNFCYRNIMTKIRLLDVNNGD